MRVLLHFRSNASGNVGIMFAFVLTLLLCVGGMAIDTAIAVLRGRLLTQATDTAVLAGAQAALQAKANGRADWQQQGVNAAKAMFAANLPARISPSDVVFTPQIKLVGSNISATASYTAKSPTTLMKVFSFDHVNVGGAASAGIAASSPIDVHFVIDNSTSMGIGADEDSQNKMLGAGGCALACHFKWGGQITSAQAHAAGARLRVDVVREATISAINSLKQKAGGSSELLRVGLHTFSSSLKTLQPLTSNVDAVVNSARGIDIDSSDYGGGTLLTAALKSLSESVPRGGDGTSNSDRKSFIVIFTDGIDDSNRMYQVPGSTYIGKYQALKRTGASRNWWDTSPSLDVKGDRMQAFDPRFCSVLKVDKNQTVMLIQMKYIAAVGLAGDSRVRFIQNSLTGPIAQATSSCASKPDYRILASTTGEIDPAFQKMVGEIAKARDLVLTQ